MAGAMEEAVQHLRVQERAMKARAEASERLSSEIIASMTSGLLVVGEDRQVRSLNPAGRRMLAVSPDDSAGDFHHVLGHAAPLADVVEECLQTAQPVLRRAVKLPQGRRRLAPRDHGFADSRRGRPQRTARFACSAI